MSEPMRLHKNPSAQPRLTADELDHLIHLLDVHWDHNDPMTPEQEAWAAQSSPLRRKLAAARAHLANPEPRAAAKASPDEPTPRPGVEPPCSAEPS